MRDLLQFIKWIIKTTFEMIAAAALFILFIGFMLFALEWVVENGREIEKVLENPQTYNLWDAAKYFGLLILGCWISVLILAGAD